MNLQYAWILILLVALPRRAECKCAVDKGDPQYAADCASRKSKTKCLAGFSQKNDAAGIRSSCIWSEEQPDGQHYTVLTWNKVGGIKHSAQFNSFLNYRGTLCRTVVNLTLSDTAQGKWSAYLTLQGGPQNVSDYAYYPNPSSQIMVSRCTAGGGGGANALSCSANVTAPPALALRAPYSTTGIFISFFATDPSLINQYRTTGKLAVNLVYKLEVTQQRCPPGPASPPPNPAISDIIQYGPTDYYLQTPRLPGTQFIKPYFLLSYRSYKISKMLGADWRVTVTKTLEGAVDLAVKTNMTSLLMTEGDWVRWSEKQCRTKCGPPLKFALPNTLCVGTQCIGKARGLDPKKSYRLVVSYPRVHSYYWNNSYSATGPVPTEFTRQMVRTQIIAKDWRLAG